MVYDAIVVAGDREGSYTIYGENKAFLELEGFPMIFYVIEALKEARTINNIYLIGPKDKLEDVSKKYSIFSKVKILEQRKNLLENAWYAFLHTLPNYREDNPLDDYLNSSLIEKAVLVLPGDIPLVTSSEIDQFLNQCDTSRFDYFLGMTPEESFRYFYPTEDLPGIKMVYFYVKENVYRHNNLHLVKPFLIFLSDAKAYIQRLYEYRYQRRLKNVIGVAKELIRMRKFFYKSLFYYGIMQLSMNLSRVGLEKLTYITRQFCPLISMEKCISELLGARFTIVETKFGGAALDIDNERDYENMKFMFSRWKKYLKSLE